METKTIEQFEKEISDISLEIMSLKVAKQQLINEAKPVYAEKHGDGGCLTLTAWIAYTGKLMLKIPPWYLDVERAEWVVKAAEKAIEKGREVEFEEGFEAALAIWQELRRGSASPERDKPSPLNQR